VNLSGRGDKDMETAGKYFRLLDAEALAAEDEAPLDTDQPASGAGVER